MPIPPFLAMTAAEIRSSGTLPGKVAWMACHFSPYGTGLTNLPAFLPPGSLLMVDDVTPPHGHDPKRIAAQLWECTEALECSGILLDFQRPGNPETAKLAQTLVQALPCPVGVSEHYAADGDFPVCLSPVPPSVPLREHMSPWTGREIWLELALDGHVITLTEQGANVTPLPFADCGENGFREEALHCHYQIELENDAARFTLWRTQEDLQALMQEAKNRGISCFVGLYQELQNQAVQPS